MRTIPLRVDDDKAITTRSILHDAANWSDQGMTLAHMRRAMRVLDALDALADDADTIRLEEDTVAFLKEQLLAIRWSRPNRTILLVSDDLENSPEQPA